MDGARRAVAGRGTKRVSAAGGRTYLARYWGRTVPRVERIFPTPHHCEAHLVNGARSTGHRTHQTRLWVLFCAETRTPHQPVRMRTSRREEFQYTLWLKTLGSGNLNKTKKATAPQDQGSRGTALSLCLQPGPSHPRWRILLLARTEWDHGVMSTGKKGNTSVTINHASSLCPVSLRQQER